MSGFRLAAPCTRCGQLYVDGTSQTCRHCLRGKIKQRSRAVLCDCGKPAVQVALVVVGLLDDSPSTERMPLCAACLEALRQMEDQISNEKK